MGFIFGSVRVNMPCIVRRHLMAVMVITAIARLACAGEPVAIPSAARSGAAERLVIENDSLRVSYDAANASFSVQCKGTQKTFLCDGRFPRAGGLAKTEPTTDARFGAGAAIEIAYPNGNRDSIALDAHRPWVFFRSTLHNGGAEPLVVDRLPLVSVAVDCTVPPDAMRAFGTGGLTAVEKNPGSYAYLALVNPVTRAGVVGGWLTHDRGSGVLFSSVEQAHARIQAQIDYGRLRVKPGQDAQSETFVVGWFDDARLGLEAYADTVAAAYSLKLPPQPAGYCTWYADKHGGACDEKHLAELSAFAAEKLKPFGFDFIQIDDGWQAGVSSNGPRRGFTAHNPRGPYPRGMQAMAGDIRRLGLTPGIWFMPFAGTSYDPLFQDHQDWFATGPDGKPFEARWGGTCLDMTQPGAREHLRDVVDRIAHQWGYKIFKMDGLWTGTATRLMYVNNGYQDDHIGEARLHDPDKTQIEAFRDGLRLVRQVAGPDVFLLGCCVSQNMRSFGGAFGLLDAMRVGPDTGAGRIGAPHGSRNYFLHGRVWYNDPDCVSVRASTPLDQARLNASWTAISGQLFYNSDWMPDLPPERFEILKRTIPAHGLVARPVDLFENDPAQIWLLTDARRRPRRDVVALYNWDQKQAATVSCDLARLGLPKSPDFVGFDFWANRFVPPFRGSLNVELPAASCRILAVRPTAAWPQLLSTSRHVTQGMLEVVDERWDAAARTLSGVSRVVAGDPYELRIVVPLGGNSWLARQFSIAQSDVAAGVQCSFQQDGPKLRASLLSPVGRDVGWKVRFESGPVEVPQPARVAGLEATSDYAAVKLRWKEDGADGYRVARSDGANFQCVAAHLTDGSVAHGKKYRYTVQAVGWTGAASAPAAIEVATPAKLRRPPRPPRPDVQLADLKPLSATIGFGKLGINKSVLGGPLRIEGKRYAHGLGTHANALLVYAIPAGAKRFVATVGLDDEKRNDPRGSITFEVYGDVREMGEPPVLLAASPVLSAKTIRDWAFDLPLNARFKQLRLVVTDAGDGIACDHADFADAGFVSQ
jgi:hypothetical protein